MPRLRCEGSFECYENIAVKECSLTVPLFNIGSPKKHAFDVNGNGWSFCLLVCTSTNTTE